MTQSCNNIEARAQRYILRALFTLWAYLFWVEQRDERA
jgi:hypothetical protein